MISANGRLRMGAQVGEHAGEHCLRVRGQARVLAEGLRPVRRDHAAHGLADVGVARERDGEQIPTGRRGQGGDQAGYVQGAMPSWELQ